MLRAWFALALLAFLFNAYAFWWFSGFYAAQVQADRYLYRAQFSHRVDRWTGQRERWDREAKAWEPSE